MRAPTDLAPPALPGALKPQPRGHAGIPDRDGLSRGVEGDTLQEVGGGTHRRELCRSVEQESSVGMDFLFVTPQTCDC